jgi:hypothetical protein
MGTRLEPEAGVDSVASWDQEGSIECRVSLSSSLHWAGKQIHYQVSVSY